MCWGKEQRVLSRYVPNSTLDTRLDSTHRIFFGFLLLADYTRIVLGRTSVLVETPSLPHIVAVSRLYTLGIAHAAANATRSPLRRI